MMLASLSLMIHHQAIISGFSERKKNESNSIIYFHHNFIDKPAELFKRTTEPDHHQTGSR
jgi:hypothetical protein